MKGQWCWWKSDKYAFTKQTSPYLTLELNPGALLLGLHLFLLVLLHTLQEAVSALRVSNMLNTHINFLSQDPSPESHNNSFILKQGLCWAFTNIKHKTCSHFENLVQTVIHLSRVHKDKCSTPYEWPYRTLSCPYGKVNGDEMRLQLNWRHCENAYGKQQKYLRLPSEG